MSWKDNNTLELSISCGDGKVYTPDYLNARLLTPFNISEFDFEGIPGSLIVKGQPKARRYSVEFIFQGEDHLTVSAAFRDSADKPGEWTVNHPKYGQLIMQPLDLEYDNTVENITRITGVLLETISNKKLRPEVDAPQKVADQFQVTKQQLADNIGDEVPTFRVNDIQQLRANVNGFYERISATIGNAVDYTQFTNTYNDLNQLINNSIFNSVELVGQAQEILAFPALFVDTAVNRVQILFDQLIYLFTVTQGSARSLKKIYENNAATVVGAMCLASITNYSYGNRKEVMGVIQNLIDGYNNYLANLDAIQTLTGAELTSYIPDATNMIELANLVNFTVSTLLDIASNSKQERSYILPENSNMILEAWKLYGLKDDDSTLDLFMNSNELTVDELLLLKKGKRVIYYV